MKLTIKEIVEATKGDLLEGDIQKEIKGICIDSRKVVKDELFIPLVGENFNGHDFIKDAIEKGACAVLTSEGNFEEIDNISIIKVKNTLQALQDLARYYASKFSIPIIGVTGSTGKTSTKDMIYSVLSKKYKVLRNKGNFNNHIGLPLTIFELTKEHEMAILEMGMSALGEIDLLASLVKPHVGVITNVGLSHIEHLKTQENIMKAKMEITNYFQDDHILIVNGDDDLLKTLKGKKTHYKKYFVGRERCDYRVSNIKDLGEKGISFDLILDNEEYSFFLKVPGIHNVYNALCAIAVGILFKVDMNLIQKGIREFEGSNMRLHIFTTKEEIKVINDAYNASPDSMRAALCVLDKMKCKRKIAVLGTMLEMGEYAQIGHYHVGSDVAKANIDYLIAVGNQGEHMVMGATENGFKKEKTYVCKNNQEAIEVLKKLLQKEDAILIKGSRGIHMEEIVDYIQERS
ncbi:UDP-N-acetylmuramoyl-tripeptide--D-alanyl-D-alanine ligase [Inediibacterium massiliense]|uniref:UDP-N-acetylmuramoyl-tripeptide--D-alanyl-D- alanine ligase n=1 Tax=Inediibacterium massiliense TaxID=1658111 RepID=UPI0006B515D9|nr:UDP-N-acetylmuramoyl-tripeptide--D-alanyl-D-alanine ligase [Inediibacterium massiliense]